jgi:hypothetical protein
MKKYINLIIFISIIIGCKTNSKPSISEESTKFTNTKIIEIKFNDYFTNFLDTFQDESVLLKSDYQAVVLRGENLVIENELTNIFFIEQFSNDTISCTVDSKNLSINEIVNTKNSLAFKVELNDSIRENLILEINSKEHTISSDKLFKFKNLFIYKNKIGILLIFSNRKMKFL